MRSDQNLAIFNLVIFSIPCQFAKLNSSPTFPAIQYVKLQVHSMNHWVVHLSYCLEALLSYHLLAIDHCNAQSSIGGFTFMVTLCIEWSQQLSSLPKYLRYTLIARGLLGLSTAISARVKWYVGSKS